MNIGRLLADADDPRVADFMGALERVNGRGKRMPGFVRMMEGEAGAGNAGAKIAGDPRSIVNLTAWESVEALERFLWGTIHRPFYERWSEWFALLGRVHFVVWWVAEGHRPTLEEGLARLAHPEAQGDSDRAFRWRHLPRARLWRERACPGGLPEREADDAGHLPRRAGRCAPTGS